MARAGGAVLGRACVGLLLGVACGRIPLGSQDTLGEVVPTTGTVSGSEPDGAGGSSDASSSAGSSGLDGGVAEGVTAPSCRTQPRCGGEGLSCCEARSVLGGTFDFALRASGVGVIAIQVTVPTFELDVFEVTVGRFREFVADYDRWRASAHPGESAGAAVGTGGQSAWFDALPGSSAALQQGLLRCDTSPYSSWDAASDAVPMNCVSWFEASAFCAWDGGRLPTQVEWEYAAAGGDEQRLYPWGNTPEPQPQLALFGCDLDAGCALSDLSPAGEHAPGAGRWGQQDLAGSLAEWLDAVSSPMLGDRAFRGGSWIDGASELRIGGQRSAPPAVRLFVLGFRCARSPA
jgi:formylglycine-generating enzyme